MKRHIDLLNGKILPTLAGLALPIMATSLIQTAYNLTDMAWIGMLGSSAVTAVGSAGMYTWLSAGIVTLAKMGGQIKVAHSLGEGRPKEAVQYARGAIQLTVLLALVFGVFVNLFARPLIGFFGLSNLQTVADAVTYLRIVCGFIVLPFLAHTMTGLFTAIGDSKTPFLANSLGLIVNMALDPILILGIGPFPRLGVAGAATATILAQCVVVVVIIICAVKDKVLFDKVNILEKTKSSYYSTIIRLGFPSAAQNILYSSISMVVTRMVASWGDAAVAVQRVGSQIEGLSWATAEGFGAAMNAFTGQNYGARKHVRIKNSYYTAATIIFVWGLFTTALLVFGAEQLFSLFIRETEVIPIGIDYLVIIGYGQMFMCEELMTVGALQGMGKTTAASLITIILTASRIPLAFLLGNTALGLNGIWWALTISSVAKGTIFIVYYIWTLKKLPMRNLQEKR